MENKITIVISVMILLILSYLKADAQLIPVPAPAPAPNTMDNSDKKQTEADTYPPHIEVLTADLKQGKNVFKVRITDESTLELREVKYVHDGKISSTDLAKDQNNIYKGLITAKPPSAVVVINVGDIYGNKATATKLLTVHSSPDLISQILNFFNIN